MKSNKQTASVPATSAKTAGKIHPKSVKLKKSERQPCEIWTRVMGYYRPVSQFNRGKKAEFYERKYFREEKICPKTTPCPQPA